MRALSSFVPAVLQSHNHKSGLTLMAGALAASLLMSTLPAIAEAKANKGPRCDFASRFAAGEETFGYREVIDCFDSVPLNPADVGNTVEVALYWMEQSTPAVAYDAQVRWRDTIIRLNRSYRGDFEFQQATFQAIQNTLKNAHYNYLYPACYRAFRAIQPLAFGSVIVHDDDEGEQIIFVEGTVGSEAYLAETEIDAAPFVGKKVVSINGVPALRFLTRWARTRGRWDRDGGNELDRILMNNTYSVRSGATDLVFPERRINTYVLEDVYGRRQRVRLPWIFEVQIPGFLRDSVAELAAFCATPNPLLLAMEEAMAATSYDELGPAARELYDRVLRPDLFTWGMDMDFEDDDERGRKTEHWIHGGFVEIPDDQRGILLEDFSPPLRIRGWTALKYNRGEATVIQIANQVDLLPDTIQLLREATNFACANSDRVIVDLRGNPGGILLEADWLSHYFYPDQGITPDRTQSFGPGTTAYQILQVQYWTDVFYGGGFWAQTLGLPLGACTLAFEPGCFASVKDGNLLDSLDWYTDTVFERLGGRTVALNPLFHFAQSPFLTPLEEIQCPGQFERDRFIVLTDGRTCSTSFQLANQLAPRATVVSIGGVVGEDKAIGVCRGGNVTDTNTLTFLQSLVTTELANLGVDGSKLIPPVSTGPNAPLFNRDVNMRVELWSVRNADLSTIVAEDPPLGPRPDLIVRTWQDVFDEDTNGFVYRKVLQAVKEDIDDDDDDD